MFTAAARAELRSVGGATASVGRRDGRAVPRVSHCRRRQQVLERRLDAIFFYKELSVVYCCFCLVLFMVMLRT